MGSVFNALGGSSPSLPAPPAPSTMRDEIGGVEQVPVKNADGSITYVTRKLPLTEEEQAKQDTYDRIMSESLSEIEALSSADYTLDEETQNVLKDWQERKNKQLDTAYSDRQKEEEKLLARRGLSDSSTSLAVRRQRQLDKQDALDTVAGEADVLKSDIRSQRLANQQNLYALAANQQNLDQVQTYQTATLGQRGFSALDTSNRASIADYYNNQNVMYQSKLQNPTNNLFGSSVNMQTVGTAAGTAIGGPVGGAIGSVLGGLFK